MSDQRLTLGQMAERLNISTKTFRAQIREQGVPFVRAGKRMKFDAAKVLAYLETTEKPVESNVVAFPLVKKKRGRVTSRKFAEAR